MTVVVGYILVTGGDRLTGGRIGGFVTAPRWAFYNLEGRWDIENHGVDPDVEVELGPFAARAGRDPQLARAVEVLMGALRTSPPPKYDRPNYPDYHRRMPGAAVDAP